MVFRFTADPDRRGGRTRRVSRSLDRGSNSRGEWPQLRFRGIVAESHVLVSSSDALRLDAKTSRTWFGERIPSLARNRATTSLPRCHFSRPRRSWQSGHATWRAIPIRPLGPACVLRHPHRPCLFLIGYRDALLCLGGIMRLVGIEMGDPHAWDHWTESCPLNGATVMVDEADPLVTTIVPDTSAVAVEVDVL